MPILGGLLIAAAIRMTVRLPGKRLHRKFIKLGNFTNLTKEDFFAAIGPCQAVSNHENDTQLCQWYATGYRMAILFDRNGKFLKIQSEAQS